MKGYVELKHICGDKATDITVAAFNSCQYVKSDLSGQYVLEAYKPYKSGVIVRKRYIKG
jgi:hypothetical protein